MTSYCLANFYNWMMHKKEALLSSKSSKKLKLLLSSILAQNPVQTVIKRP